jgi:hypothetical protein
MLFLWFKNMTGLDLILIRVVELLKTIIVLDRKYRIF